MSSKLFVLYGVLITCSFFRSALSQKTKGYYTIVAPGTIRSNSIYHVSISLSNFHQSCWFNISIEPKLTRYEYQEIIETVEVQPGATKLVKIRMPWLEYGQGRLIVYGYRGIITREVGLINVEDRYYMVYIQTDKGQYKPGEVMKFRVICIDRLTRPARVDDAIAVLFYDGQGNLVKKISPVELVQGVFKGVLQLSVYPVLGEWKIEVKANGLTMQEKSFRVARYVLPKFSVEIITKKDVAVNDGQILITVKASYVYGEPVKGNLSILLHTTYTALGAQRPLIIKETQIDAETTVILDLKTDLNIDENISGNRSIRLYIFHVTAMVQDVLTKQYSQTKTEIIIHSHPYKIKVDAPKSFDPEKLVNITISVKDLQNTPIRDTKIPVMINAEGSRFEHRRPISLINQRMTPNKRVHTVYLNENGVGSVSLNLTDEIFNQYKVYAEYRGWISDPEILEKDAGNTFKLDILTERPEVGKEFVVQLKSNDPIVYFVYEIISRGDIVQSERINVSGNETTYPLRINATYSMVPKITLFLHRVQNSVFDSRLKEIHIKRAFQNSIEINTDDEVKPGTSVSVNVTTDEDSYVGLMGIDRRLLLQTSTIKDDLTEDHVFTELRNYDSLNMNSVRYPGIEAGLITFSNAHNRAGNRIGETVVYIVSGDIGYPAPAAIDNPTIELPRVRIQFSETWMFNDFEKTPLDGLKLNEQIPDTITSWAITGFSLNSKTGLTLTKNATILKVFQEFFISMDLPSLVKEGEIIEIPVYVFNYMKEDLCTNVTIDNSNACLELLDSLNAEVKFQPNKTITKSIPAQGITKFIFFVKPCKSGRFNVSVNAISPKASDAIQKTLTVSPEGVPYSISKAYLVHFLQENEQEDEISVDIPENAVRGSESVHLSVIGDIFGPIMRSLEKLVHVPYGNGVDNIRYFVSNLLVLKYLKVLNHSNPKLESKARLHLELGYQTQLAFKHLDGSFSFFDRTMGRTGDIGLTAYVMWGLQQARYFIQVDRKVIDRGLGYLKSKQEENGSFISDRGAENDAALTALTLLSFLVDDRNQYHYQDVIAKCLTYLYEILDDLEQTTPALIATYALVIGKHEESGELLAKLTRYDGSKSKQKVWAKPDTLQSSLETTASSFLNLLESQKKPVQTLLPIVKALISTEHLEKTPTHMIALEAMIKFAQDMDFSRKDLNIYFNDNQGISGELRVDSNNAQVLQTVKLTQSSRNISLQTKGNGFAIVNIEYTYNLFAENQSSSNYHTNITFKDSTERVIALETCVAIRSSGNQSNLSAMEINLQSGYTFDEKTFDEIYKINKQVRLIQANGNEGSILVYIENISKNGTCFCLAALRTWNVFNAQPASVVVYDVRAQDQRSVSFYTNDFSKEGHLDT